MILSDSIKTGISMTLYHVVTESDTANHYGSGHLEVYATPAMISFMEKTSMEAVQQYLPEGYGTVGTHLNIRHLKPTTVNTSVHCTSELIERENRRLVFKVFVSDINGLIGEGTHERFIVEEARFLKKISE